MQGPTPTGTTAATPIAAGTERSRSVTLAESSRGRVFARHHRGNLSSMSLLLWIVAVILAIVGIVQLLQGQIILGIVLLVVACLVGPGGYSISRGRAGGQRPRRWSPATRSGSG